MINKKAIVLMLLISLFFISSIYSSDIENNNSIEDSTIKILKNFFSLPYILKDSVEWNSSEFYVFSSGQLRSKQINLNQNVIIKNGKITKVFKNSSILFANNINGRYVFNNASGIVSMELSATFPDIDSETHYIKITKSQDIDNNLLINLDNIDYTLDNKLLRKILIGILAVGFDRYYI